MKIIDYEQKYKYEIMKLQANQWGDGSDSDDIFNNINDYSIKLAVEENKVIGTLIFHEKNKYTLYLDMIVISPNFQKLGIGTLFMQYAIDYAKSHNFKQIESEAIEANGHINSKKLLDKFGFVETRSIKNYWGILTPNFNCKECGHMPCTCTMHEYYKYL